MTAKKTTAKTTRAKAAPKKTIAKKAAPAKAAAKPKAKAPSSRMAGGKGNLMKRILASFPAHPGASNGARSQSRSDETRRPPNNPEMPMDYIEDMITSFSSWKSELEDFSAHLRALDRMRLNGVGIKKMGFIERALQLAAENPEFLPHYLTLRKFQHDNNYFLALRTGFDLVRQVQEILWNIIIESSDVIYTDGLEYYAGVREAAKRRVDPAETLFNDLSIFFKRRSGAGDKPTEKQLKRDFEALEKGRKNGRLLIENEMPKTTAGSRKVIDETYKDTARFKESEEGEIKE